MVVPRDGYEKPASGSYLFCTHDIFGDNDIFVALVTWGDTAPLPLRLLLWYGTAGLNTGLTKLSNDSVLLDGVFVTGFCRLGFIKGG
jgi:hypothetical protein